MSTPNLAIAHIQASQNSKEVTANEAYDRIDAASFGLKAITMTDANYTLTTYGGVGFPNDTENLYFLFTGTLTAGRNIIVPNTHKAYVVKNSTTGGFAITVKTAAGTGIAIANGATVVVFCDSVNVVQVTSAPFGGAFINLSDAPASYSGAANKFVQVNGAGTALIFTALAAVATGGLFTNLTDVPASYSGTGGFMLQVNAGATAVEFVAKPLDIGFFLPGKPTASQVVIRIIPVRAASFPASMTGSTSKAGAASTGTVLYTFKKNGASFATLTFTAADSGTWTSASGASFNGTTDILTVEAPSSVDATLTDVGIVMKGTRT